MTPVRWTDQAIDDVLAIRAFIERDSARYGRLVAERIVDATSRIELFPKAGRVVPEIGRDDVREIIVGEYRVVYGLAAQNRYAAAETRSWGPRGLFEGSRPTRFPP